MARRRNPFGPSNMFDKIKAEAALTDLRDILEDHGFKMKLTVWKADGETWEITPVSITKVKNATVRVSIIDVEEAT